jgi:hypothetical protein
VERGVFWGQALEGERERRAAATLAAEEIEARRRRWEQASMGGRLATLALALLYIGYLVWFTAYVVSHEGQMLVLLAYGVLGLFGPWWRGRALHRAVRVNSDRLMTVGE